MSATTLSLATGQNLSFRPYGMRIEGDMTYQDWTTLLSTLHNLKSSYHCVLADTIAYGKRAFGEANVAIALEQAEFDLSDVTKAEAIGQLSLDFRQRKPLTSEHYFILSTLDTEHERNKWADAAQQHNLTALELKRSITAKKILRQQDIQKTSGQGTGITTIQGAAFRLQQWQREMGGVEGILKLPKNDRRSIIEILTPTIELAAAIEESLESPSTRKP